MKMIIDIDEKWEAKCSWFSKSDVLNYLYDIIRNGTPIPDKATNGDVIKVIFPNSDIEEHRTYMKIVEGDYLLPCAYQWWNAPYQKGGKE